MNNIQMSNNLLPHSSYCYRMKKLRMSFRKKSFFQMSFFHKEVSNDVDKELEEDASADTSVLEGEVLSDEEN